MENYKKQRNKCVFLNKKAKRDAMKNVNVKGIDNAKNFWKTYKPYLSHNQIIDDKIILLEEDEIVSDDLKNYFFVNYFSFLFFFF